MFVQFEALNFRSLRFLRQQLSQFHVLVGPNASGKSTFLDALAFMGDLIRVGLPAAIEERTATLRELFTNHAGDRFELAVEALIPPEVRPAEPEDGGQHFRYELAIGIDPATGENSILHEIGMLRKPQPRPSARTSGLFPESTPHPETLCLPPGGAGVRTVFSKRPAQRDNFFSESEADSDRNGLLPAFALGPRKSTLANLPEDETRFPAATWFKRFLAEGVHRLMLNSLAIRRLSPPGQPRHFRPDGSNIPWVLHDLEKSAPENVRQWVAHLQSALPDLRNVTTLERIDDRSRYLVIEYAGGLKVPAWMVSDGTLRLLALTLPAYLPRFSGVYLVEEPENGIHPRAVETMYQSLASTYGAQILMATHSPVVLSLVDAAQVLCFAKTPAGETDIVSGAAHPRLSDWQGEENLGVLFAGGILG